MSEPIAAVRARLRGTSPEPIAASLSGSAGGKGLMARLFAKAPTWVRRHERFPCCVIAVLHLPDKDLPLEGLVTEISQGGVLFRPASHFIFDRRGAKVTLRFADDDVDATIVNVKSHGYGVEFDEVITKERTQDILDLFGLTSAQQVQ
jgi:hypothetical protein